MTATTKYCAALYEAGADVVCGDYWASGPRVGNCTAAAAVIFWHTAQGTLARNDDLHALEEYLAVEEEIGALHLEIPQAVWQVYYLDKIWYLRAHWWNISDLAKKKAGFAAVCGWRNRLAVYRPVFWGVAVL